MLTKFKKESKSSNKGKNEHMKLTAPLLSFSATGTIADSITYSRRGGHDIVMKKPAHHTTPSPDQVAVRGRFSKGADFYINHIASPSEYDGWRRVGTYKHGRETGHNACLSSIAKVMQVDPNASMAVSVQLTVGNEVEWTLQNVSHFEEGDEAGDFRIYAGEFPTTLTFLETATIIGGKITSSDIGDSPSTGYMVIVKDGVFRSGIFKTF